MVKTNGAAPKIEQGIPIPPIARCGRPVNPNSVAQTVRRLQVGESFVTDKRAAARNEISRINLMGNKDGMQFVLRAVEGGTRVWRIK